jgi:hypothetical protein
MKIRKKRNLSSPGWANFRPIPAASPSPRVQSPSPSAHLRPASPRSPARPTCSLSLVAARPHLPAALTLALSRPRIADKLAPPVNHPISLAAHGSNVITAGHRPLLLPAALVAQRSSTPLRPCLLWSRPCMAPPRRAVPSPPLCTIYADCCAPHRRPPNTAAPLPSGAYKRAASSSSMPCIGIGHSFPPPRAQPHQLRRPSLRSGELLLLLPPLWLFSEQFTRLSSFTTSPQTRNAAPLPPITTRTSPATTPAAEPRHPTVVSSLPVTYGKIGPTLKLASLFSCNGTCPFPRNWVTGGESSLNPPSAGFSPRDGRFTPLPHLR